MLKDSIQHSILALAFKCAKSFKSGWENTNSWCLKTTLSQLHCLHQPQNILVVFA